MKTKYWMTAVSAALAIGMFLMPPSADAGRFRGANAGSGEYLIDTDGDGVGDERPTPGTGMGAGAAENFVDADGNGICDTFEDGGQQLNDGTGIDEAVAEKVQMQSRQRHRGTR